MKQSYVLLLLRGVRVVEGADLERLCGVTHRGFESLPLSHIFIHRFKAQHNRHFTHFHILQKPINYILHLSTKIVLFYAIAKV